MKNIDTIKALYDSKETEIFIGDMIKSVRTKDKEQIESYYLYDFADSGNTYLFRLDNQGNIVKGNLGHIKIDSSVTLVNDDNYKWYRIGVKGEVLSEIFK